MRWLVDGSNVLGALRWNRESRQSKERLASLCARFARQSGKRLTLCFDGAAPSGFASKLGAVTVRFCHPRSADDVIASTTRDTRDEWTVVTSDAGIASRVKRRAVIIESSTEFAARLLRLADEGGDESDKSASGSEWEDYFSDPKNRIF